MTRVNAHADAFELAAPSNGGLSLKRAVIVMRVTTCLLALVDSTSASRVGKSLNGGYRLLAVTFRLAGTCERNACTEVGNES